LDSSNNLAQEEEMLNNMLTSYVNFGYDVFRQFYPNTMHFLSVQAPQFSLTNLNSLDMNITPTEHLSSNR